jgi:thioredoxin 1
LRYQLQKSITDENMNSNPVREPIAEVGEAGFRADVLKSKLPVLVEFWAPWSKPCQILGAVLDEIVNLCAESVRIVRVNADDNPDLSMSYEIESIPTLLYFVDGALRTRVVGTVSKEAILSKLQWAIHGGDSALPAAGAVRQDKGKE